MRNHPQSSPTALRRAVCIAGALGVVLALQAQQSPAPAGQEPTQLEKTVVTGSLIPTAETIGPQPVERVDTVQIQEAGRSDVLQSLRHISASFSGNGNVGQTINNRTQGGGEANIAIRNLATLVLLDGRRLANSAFSNGAAVDVNTIPLFMIDRIEVLKDGGSTLYGSDAIGGVVNIVTKKDFNGTEISGRVGFPTRASSETLLEYQASLVSGVSTENAKFVAGGGFYHMDPLLTQDRYLASAGAVDLVNRGIAPPTYFSGSFPGRVSSYVLAGSPFVQGSPLYNPAMVTPPAGSNTLAQLVAQGVYVPIDSTPLGSLLRSNGITSRVMLNTTLFGTYSQQAQDRREAFFNFEHDLIDKKVQAFANFFYANNLSEGVLAPSPVSALGAAGYNQISIPADNPYNPFGIALGVGGSGSPQVRTRFVELGNRLFQSQYDYYRMVGGLKGDLSADYHWEAAYTYNRSEQLQYNRNIPAGDRLNLALQPGGGVDASGRPLSNLLDPTTGNPVPVYNFFALPGFNAPETINALRSTTFDSGISELWTVDALLSGKLVDVPAGQASFAAGYQYGSESLQLTSDAMLEVGSAPGLNPIPSFATQSRDRWSIFAEFNIPIFSPEMDIPALRSLEVNASFRHETYSPGGEANVPKVSARWQPIEDFMLRGSYSQSYVAPTLFNLYGPPTADVPQITFPDGSGQVNALYLANPDLPPSEAKTYNAGIVISPRFVKNLTVSVDYYKVSQDGIGATPDLNAVVSDLNANGVNSQYYAGYLSAANTHVTGPNQVNFANDDAALTAGSFTYMTQPGASQETDGFDIGLSYVLPTPEELGKITLGCNANIVMNYYFRGAPTVSRYDYTGYFTQGVLGAQGTIPDFILIPSLDWEYKNLSFHIDARYIPEVTAPGTLWPTTGSDWNDYTVDGEAWKVPSYYTINMQVSYEFGKTKETKDWYDGLRLTLGCNNVTDNMAPFIAGSTEDNTDKATYDIMGRFLYVEVAKKF